MPEDLKPSDAAADRIPWSDAAQADTLFGRGGGKGLRPDWRDQEGRPVGSHNPASPPGADRHPAFSRLMAALPKDVRDSLTPYQLAAISDAVKPQTAPHLIHFRVSLPFFGRRYYLTFYFGRERRNIQRLRNEGQIDIRLTSAVIAIAAGLVACAVIATVAIVLYLLKSALGIDLTDGPSFLHELFF